MDALVEIDRVTKVYASRARRVVALEEVDLTIAEHEIVALIGPSGCGKSTLLRVLAGLDAEFDGALRWATPPTPGQDIGFVFQDATLLPWRSVRRNVALGLEGRRTSRQIRERVDALLELVGLTEFADAYPAQLSGGMRQRVGILRALAYDPSILLMDEPFGALDAITRDRLQDDLLQIWAQTRKTIVLVTHSVDEAAYLADRVVVMSARPGRIKAIHDVPLPRERDASTRALPAFAAFAGMLRDELG